MQRCVEPGTTTCVTFCILQHTSCWLHAVRCVTGATHQSSRNAAHISRITRIPYHAVFQSTIDAIYKYYTGVLAPRWWPYMSCHLSVSFNCWSLVNRNSVCLPGFLWFWRRISEEPIRNGSSYQGNLAALIACKIWPSIQESCRPNLSGIFSNQYLKQAGACGRRPG